MIRLNEAQYRKVKKLTRRLCANNDGGCCLLLDDGDPCVCVQAISFSLLCRYFREAVLPADRELHLAFIWLSDTPQPSHDVHRKVVNLMQRMAEKLAAAREHS